MRMLILVKFPNEDFNDEVREGTAGQTINRILDKTRPECCYFTEFDGQRAAMLVVDVKDSSEIPSISEPWFLEFDAEVEFHIAMTPEDLGRAGLEKLGKKWG